MSLVSLKDFAYPKAMELYVLNNIADLSVYGVGSADNGGGSDGQEFTFPAVSVTAGEYIYIASESSQFTAYFGFEPDYTSGALSINGDDAMELFLGGGVVDVFGDINVDGTGQPWEYLDGWTYRIDGSTPPGGPTFNIAEWTFSGRNAIDGCSTNSGCSSVFPLGTFVEVSRNAEHSAFWSSFGPFAQRYLTIHMHNDRIHRLHLQRQRLKHQQPLRFPHL